MLAKGAVISAPTCSLPENIKGGRNWDYRHTWIRNAAWTMDALTRVGYLEEATEFMNWLMVTLFVAFFKGVQQRVCIIKH